ncbi:hypothetical protein F5B20DRAFT_575694 [Whalleya microplaca]|nr:hypothetical protein F5B20DRAFT_575694 [Whalleya microplaca]
MNRSASESIKTGKRKGRLEVFIHHHSQVVDSVNLGTRSVSTLTPSQLARKRANDREAQRAIRARTKEHIENLEREIEELRIRQNRDQTVQDLLRRNKALEDELRRLKECMGLRDTSSNSPYQPAYNNASSSRVNTFGQSNPDYPLTQDISYTNIPDSAESWHSCSVPSTGSSPSSTGAPEEFGNNYLPTSAPSGVLERSSMPPTMHSPATSCVNSDLGFDEVKPEFGHPQINMVPIAPTYHHPPWSMYPMYYHGSSATL